MQHCEWNWHYWELKSHCHILNSIGLSKSHSVSIQQLDKIILVPKKYSVVHQLHLLLKISGHKEVSQFLEFCNFKNRKTKRSCLYILEFRKAANTVYENVRIDTYFHQETCRSYGSKLRQKKPFSGLASLQGTKNNFIHWT